MASEKSRDLSAIKDVRTQILPSNLVPGNCFNSRPPFGVEQDLVGQPVGNGLLANGRSIEVVTDAFGEGRLASGNRDRAFESGNVVSLHAPSVTRILVGVNKEDCFSEDKEACIVLNMTTPRQRERQAKQPKAPSRPRPEVGPDGLTMPQRLERLMTDRGVGQTDLARMCSQFFASYYPAMDGAVQQQHIFNLLHKQSDSWVSPLIAHVFDVNALWLQFGIGPKERTKN